MKIGSLNVNGVRAFGLNRCPNASDFFDYFRPDILCIQETKGDLSRVNSSLIKPMNRYGYTAFVSPSNKPGYAGVGMIVKNDCDRFKSGKFHAVDIVSLSGNPDESLRLYGSGRIIMYEDNEIIVISVYTLNSGSGKSELRKAWDAIFLDWVNSLDKSKKIYILGDFNVCHTELDMWNWHRSLNSYPGLMDFEINGFNKLLHECNLVDTLRMKYPTERKYTWCAPKTPLSKGWRLDYALTNSPESVIDSDTYNVVDCSDHKYIELNIDVKC